MTISAVPAATFPMYKIPRAPLHLLNSVPDDEGVRLLDSDVARLRGMTQRDLDELRGEKRSAASDNLWLRSRRGEGDVGGEGGQGQERDEPAFWLRSRKNDFWLRARKGAEEPGFWLRARRAEDSEEQPDAEGFWTRARKGQEHAFWLRLNSEFCAR